MSDYTDAERRIEQAMVDSHAAMLERVEKLPANRWAAFSDAELAEIQLAYAVNFKMLEARGESPFQSVIASGVEAEIERRKA